LFHIDPICLSLVALYKRAATTPMNKAAHPPSPTAKFEAPATGICEGVEVGVTTPVPAAVVVFVPYVGAAMLVVTAVTTVVETVAVADALAGVVVADTVAR
jgi:hypothetical protein